MTSSPGTTNSPQIIILWQTETHQCMTFSPLKHRQDIFLKWCKGELNKHSEHMLICTHMLPLSYTHMRTYTHFYHRCCSSTWSLRNAPTVGDNVVPASILLQSSPSFPPPSQESCCSLTSPSPLLGQTRPAKSSNRRDYSWNAPLSSLLSTWERWIMTWISL